jgi:hypothetical protein
MKIYFTESRIPELKPLPVPLRRVTMVRALETMRCQRRLFYWLPALLCALGGVSGAFIGAALLSFFYAAPPALNGDWITNSACWSYAGVGVGAFSAGFLGLMLQRWKLRPYLGKAIREFAQR